MLAKWFGGHFISFTISHNSLKIQQKYYNLQQKWKFCTNISDIRWLKKRLSKTWKVLLVRKMGCIKLNKQTLLLLNKIKSKWGFRLVTKVKNYEFEKKVIKQHDRANNHFNKYMMFLCRCFVLYSLNLPALRQRRMDRTSWTVLRWVSFSSSSGCRYRFGNLSLTMVGFPKNWVRYKRASAPCFINSAVDRSWRTAMFDLFFFGGVARESDRLISFCTLPPSGQKTQPLQRTCSFSVTLKGLGFD